MTVEFEVDTKATGNNKPIAAATMSAAASQEAPGGNTENNDKKRKKERMKKPLPPELAHLTDDDREKFVIALEKDTNPRSNTYNQEFHCAQKIKLTRPLASVDSEDLEVTDYEFDISTLTLVHLRELCSNLGIRNVGSSSLFQCRKAIAILFKYAKGLDDAGVSTGSNMSRKTNTICRATNICFSGAFFDRFMKLNDIKNRVDHEGGTTYKQFWIDVADVHNEASDDADYDDDDCDDDINKIINRSNDDHIEDLAVNLETNLKCVDNLTPALFKERIKSCFAIRNKIKELMTVSGTHNSEVWDFVQTAMVKVSKCTGITKYGAYYFYKRCEEQPDVDVSFCPFMDSELKGSTLEDDNRAERKKPGKKPAIAAFIEETSRNSKVLLEELQKANQKKEDIMQKNLEEFQKANQQKFKQGALNTYAQLAATVANPDLPPASRQFILAQMEAMAKDLE